MSAIVWKDDLELGLPLIDEQHRRLVDRYNELAAAYRRREADAELAHRLGVLLDCAAVHFVSEETLMEELGYVGLAEHREEHQDLLQRVRRFQTVLAEGRQTVTLPVLQYLQHWLLGHIRGADADFGKAARRVVAEALVAQPS
ncbi:MAG: bacteriohemerythrin [bacterium]|nr:bacteriohemerythrin [bacterium]